MNNLQNAIEAYFEHCEANGYTFQQPNKDLSDEVKGIIYLRNINGHLARYSVKRGVIF